MTKPSLPSGEYNTDTGSLMAWRGMFNWLAPFKVRGTDQREAGYTTMIELEKLWGENLILAGLHNEIIDSIKHRKILMFRQIMIGKIVELYFNSIPDYSIFSGGYYMIESNILSLVR